MNDLITVVVPMYNSEKYLRETINGVINQTYKNLEIFLVDDNSSDNTLKIAKEYEKSDLRINVITQRNKRTPSTIKNIIKIAKGSYIARCDHDDINYLDRYEKQLKFLKENNYDLVSCYLKCFGNGKESSKESLEYFQRQSINNFEDQNQKFMRGFSITGSTFLIKKNVLLEHLPFRKEFYILEDYYLLTVLNKARCRIGIFQEEKLNYRVHENNLSLSEDKLISKIKQFYQITLLYQYKDILNNAQNIIIIKPIVECYIINEIMDGEKNKHKFKYIHDNVEHQVELISQLDSSKTIIILGNKVSSHIEKYIINCGYKYFENYFIIMDAI